MNFERLKRPNKRSFRIPRQILFQESAEAGLVERAAVAGDKLNEGIQKLFAYNRAEYLSDPTGQKIMCLASPPYIHEADQQAYAAHAIFPDNVGYWREGQVPLQIAIVSIPLSVVSDQEELPEQLERVGELAPIPGKVTFEVSTTHALRTQHHKTIELAEFVADKLMQDCNQL